MALPQHVVLSIHHDLHPLSTRPQTMQRTHTKQMEHLRFLIHNRLNAKPQGPPHAAANEDNAAETPEVVSVPFDLHMRGVRSGVASAAAANASTTDDGEDEQGVAASSAVPAAASTAAVNTSDTAAPYDDDEDLQGQADWKEGIQPIGYLRSCFRRKVGALEQGRVRGVDGRHYLCSCRWERDSVAAGMGWREARFREEHRVKKKG